MKHALAATLGLLLLLAGACKDPGEASPAVDPETAYLPDMEELFGLYQELQEAGAFNALGDTLSRANRDLLASELYVQAAFAYGEAGNADSAAAMLHRAIDRGMSNPWILEKFPGDGASYTDDTWVAVRSRLDSIRVQMRRPANFDLKTTAMGDFWPYFEKAMADTSQARRQLRRFILEGPREVRDFYVVRYGSVDQMYGQMINGAPNYYRYLKTRFQPDSLRAFKQTILQSMERFRELYPRAVFPKVYIVPGILNSGGTATEMGMFLGGDMYGKSPQTPTEELSDWQQDAIMGFEELPRLTLHELMHFQQHYGDTIHRETLLAAVIREGVCDFMVELCTGEPLQHENLTYLSDPMTRDWIFGELGEELMGEDYSKWLYNGGSIEDRPHDLGYTVGYLISKSYYQRHPDKEKAVELLLNTDDFTEIVENSAYSYLLGGPDS